MDVMCCLCGKLEGLNKTITVAKALQDDDISEGLQSCIGPYVSTHRFYIFISGRF